MGSVFARDNEKQGQLCATEHFLHPWTATLTNQPCIQATELTVNH